MESQRRQYYKKITTVDLENDPTTNRRSSRQRNIKRKGNKSPVQDDAKFVSKLKRANTADYISTGLPIPAYLGTESTNELRCGVLGNNRLEIIDSDAPVNVSLSPVDHQDTSVDLDPPEKHRHAQLKDTSPADLDPQVYESSLTSDFKDTSVMDLNLSVDENPLPENLRDTSRIDTDPIFDESLRSAELEDTSEMNSSTPLDVNHSPEDLQDTSIDLDSLVYEKLRPVEFKDTSPIDSHPPVDESLRSAELEVTSAMDLDPPVDESLIIVGLEDTSALDPDLSIDKSLRSAELKDLEDSAPIQLQCQIDCTPPKSHLKNKKGVEKKILSRDEEIEICMQEIRDDNDNIKIENPKGCEVNQILIELELEQDKENNENSSITNKKDTGKRSKREVNKELKYQYIDFLSDDECFVWSSSSWDESQTDSEANDLSGIRKRKKKQQKKKKSNRKMTNKMNGSTTFTEQRNEKEETASVAHEEDKRKKKKRINISKERSRLRNSGQEYITKTGNTIEAKNMKENPCQPGKCPNECYNISDEKRCSIFNYYWALNKERRSDWIVSHSKRDKIKRKRTNEVESRRQWSHSYFINDGEGQKKVCLKFLLNTLDIRQKFVHFTIENSLYGSSKDDRRGKHVPANKTSEVLMQSFRSYLQNLPAVPSHYCRKNTKKCYLPQEYKNLSNLYKIYKETKKSEGNAYVGEKVFKKVFNTEYNMSFHVPRKDKCTKCIKYENDKIEEFKTEKELHLKDKEDTYARFKIHQQANEQDPSILCVTFDLQKVLNTPYGPSMLLYYSRKLAVYNLTFYESQTREGFCYTWNESQGKRGTNEICTILSKYIEKVDSRGTVKHLLLYCDSCPGQNKNRIVLACIHQSLQKCTSIISIQINYLLPGHTYMPVDSMHAVIEKSVANTIIWAPSQWATVFSLARKSPKPYEVKTLTHKDFEGWDAMTDKYFKGNMVGKISKVRSVTFKKSNLDKMYIKNSMAVDAEIEIIEILVRKEIIPKKIYKAPLPISKKKYADLLKLCTNKTIPEICRNEFIDLPNAANVQDVLPESDIEDEELD